ncbi:hypothetical protein VSF3289_03551 [Vibrio scophthalmi]|uniref:Uncharacterized protein n=1 Tax=Vibrio scophthalmi TaxID=45658 RepID=A0A1E3WFV8_9VIBR|nr:hypothetical protein VSF3289_03551 [Vibrio scophthalmi]
MSHSILLMWFCEITRTLFNGGIKSLVLSLELTALHQYTRCEQMAHMQSWNMLDDI